MSTSTDPLASTGLEDLRGMLAGLQQSSGPVDPRTRQQAALLAFGRRTSAQTPLKVLMQDAVTMASEVLKTDLHGVAELDGSRLVLTVAASDPQGNVVDAITHESSLQPGSSAAAYAIRSGLSVAAAEIASEQRFADSFLRKLGIVSALVVPLHLGGKPFGARSLYHKTQRRFTLDYLRFVETIGHLLAGSVAREKLEGELLQVRTLASAVMEMVGAPLLNLDPDGNIIDMNAVCEQIGEFPLEEVRGQPFWNAMVAAEDAEAVHRVFYNALRGGLPESFEATLISKQGRRRRIAWSWKILFDGKGQVERLVLTGLDRTAPVEARDELRELRECVAKATEALHQLGARLEGVAPTESPSGPDESGTAADPPGEPRPFQPLGPKPPKDLRRSPRRTFRYLQRVAPMFGGRVPSRKKLFEVECKDISAGGVAFFLDRPPDFDTLVVALGRPPGESFFTARVVRVVRTDLDGRRLYLVGCRFTGRVSI